MKPYLQDIEEAAMENDAFRRVVYTTPSLQVHLLSLLSNEEVGTRLHDCDYFYFLVQGAGVVIVDGKCTAVSSGWCLLSPAGTAYNIINTGSITLKLLALSAPPAYRQGATYRTRRDAEMGEGPCAF